MSDYTLTIPDDIVAMAQQIAEDSGETLEEILLRGIKTSLPLPILSATEEAELEALTYLSNDALITIANEQMAPNVQNRFEELMTQNSKGTINSVDRHELEGLVDKGQQLMLRKSEAAAILSQRNVAS